MCCTMDVSGPGVPSGVTVAQVNPPSGGTRIIILSANVSSQPGDIITFTLDDNAKEIDYLNTTNFRNLLQDFYATGQTYAQETAAGVPHNPVTNGQNDYDSHLYWFHSGQERPLGYLGFREQGGALVASIGPGTYPNPFFPSAKILL